MRINRFRFARIGVLLALVVLAVSTGFASNTQAASVTANKPLLWSNHTAEGDYEALRFGQDHSSAQFLAEYNKAHAMQSASSLPGAVYRTNSSASSTPSSYGLPGGRWTAIGPTAMDTNQGNPYWVSAQDGPNSGRGVGIVVDTNTTGANTVLYEAAS